MKIIRFLLTAAIFTFVTPSVAKASDATEQKTKPLTYQYMSYLEFKENNYSFYKSNHFNVKQDDKMPFEMALESEDVEKGEWSMHVTDPTPLNIKYDVVEKTKLDIASQILYVGMRYKFEK